MNTVYKIVRKEYFLILTLLFLSGNGIAQIGAPTFAFTEICASGGPSTNTWAANFTFSSANTYTLEMSDANGSFATLTPITILSSQTTTSPGSFSFSIPTSTAGQLFKLRVRGSSPAVTGANSVTFAAHYMIYDKIFYINDQVSNVNICGGGSFLLAIDNETPTVIGSSPATYPNLKYRWYRNGVQIPGEVGTSISVNTAGTYRCEIDYGTCPTTFTKSQDVNVSIVSAGAVFTITSSSGNAICSPASTTLSTTQGYSYQWFKDSVLIPGATNYSYVTNQAGAYNVVVNQGGCSSTSNTLNITTSGINATIDVPTSSIIEEGETKTITVTTNASNPTYQWYDANGPITGETASSFTTNLPGSYKVVVTQTTGCVLTKEVPFTLRLGVKPTKIPNTISPNGDDVNNFWQIPEEYQTEDTEVMIVDSYGKMVLQKKNYQNDWPESAIEFKSVNPVFYYIITKDGGEVKKGSITVIK